MRDATRNLVHLSPTSGERMPLLPALVLTCALLGGDAHPPNAFRKADGTTRPLTAEEYEKMKKKARKRGQCPGALYDPSLPGFDPLSWPHVVRSPSRVVHQVAREYHLKLMLADGSTSTVWVAYPKSADVNWKSGRRAAIRLYEAGSGESRCIDLMLGGMVGHGKHIARVGGACTEYACNTTRQVVNSACGILSRLYDQLFVDKGIDYETLPRMGGNSAQTTPQTSTSSHD